MLAVTVSPDGSSLENQVLRIELREDGVIGSVLMKETDREMLAGEGAGIFRLYEDKPFAFGAWDISLYCAETFPETAKLQSRSILKQDGLIARIEQVFTTPWIFSLAR